MLGLIIQNADPDPHSLAEYKFPNPEAHFMLRYIQRIAILHKLIRVNRYSRGGRGEAENVGPVS
jgi:hypothetical protein